MGNVALTAKSDPLKTFCLWDDFLTQKLGFLLHKYVLFKVNLIPFQCLRLSSFKITDNLRCRVGKFCLQSISLSHHPAGFVFCIS